MSLHTPPSTEAKRRVRWQRMRCSVLGLAVAVAIVTTAGMLLNGIAARTGPEYLPLFAGWSYEPNGCGGKTCCGPSPMSIMRNPAGMPVRPLGLAPSVRDGMRAFPSEDFDAEILKVVFADTVYTEDEFD